MALELCKYYKKQRYVSYNNGVTWQPLEEYEKGELYETHSASCGAGFFQYRWILVDNAYVCDGNDRFTKQVYQYSEDGSVWYNVFPTQYRKGTLVESESNLCDNAGIGNYTSGGTDPIDGETLNCPSNYTWNGTECVCKGHMVDGECTECSDMKGEMWMDGYGCVCKRYYSYKNGICVYVDPLKVVKCADANGVIGKSDVDYYEEGWAAISYVIGDCVTRIGDNAFNGQVMLTSVTLSDSVSEVGSLAFANCSSLTTLSFPSSLSYIGENAFNMCLKLKNVTFGGTIPTVLPKGMMAQCTDLESATWLQSNDIESIGDYCFYNCYSLGTIALPSSLQTIGAYAFSNNFKLENVSVQGAVTSIGNGAFKNCKGMLFAIVDNDSGDTVTIGSEAFANCASLTSITIDSNSVVLGNNAFKGCTRLLKIKFTATSPFEIPTFVFNDTNKCEIIVPCGSVDAYKTAWSLYADRISCNDTGVYYRWVSAEGYYCEGTDAYTREKQQKTTNGIVWSDTGAYRGARFITHYSKACGYTGDVALTVIGADGHTRYFEPC